MIGLGWGLALDVGLDVMASAKVFILPSLWLLAKDIASTSSLGMFISLWRKFFSFSSVSSLGVSTILVNIKFLIDLTCRSNIEALSSLLSFVSSVTLISIVLTVFLKQLISSCNISSMSSLLSLSKQLSFSWKSNIRLYSVSESSGLCSSSWLDGLFLVGPALMLRYFPWPQPRPKQVCWIVNPCWVMVLLAVPKRSQRMNLCSLYELMCLPRAPDLTFFKSNIF